MLKSENHIKKQCISVTFHRQHLLLGNRISYEIAQPGERPTVSPMRKTLRIALAALLPLSATASGKPNIIVIMADDLGYGDLSCYGATAFKTPNIDKLAAQGQRFTSGYCSASTCTPTRFSFLTGTYAFRQKGTGIAPPNGPAIIRPGTTTIASLMQSAGYRTAVIGKWHLGLGDKKPEWNGDLKPGPLEIGFDQCFLLPTTNDRVPQVYVKDHNVLNLDPADPLTVSEKPIDPNLPTGKSHRDTLKMDWSHGHNGTIHNGISRIGFYTGGTAARFHDEDLGDKWVEQSRAYIAENKDKPFFLFFASHDIHVPRTPHERFVGKSGLGPRGDAIIEMDWCVGEIMTALEEHKLTENTLVVFCSDNGPVLDDGYKDGAVTQLGDHDPAGPYSGGKYSVFEGGTRTPFITRWPGKIPVGTSDKIVCTIDLATSLAKLTGAEIPENGCLDSLDVLPALLGQASAIGRSELLQQDNGGAKMGLRIGDWKLIHSNKQGGWGAVISRKKMPQPKGPNSIYFLPDDPSESKDLSAENPDKAKELIARLDAIIAAGRTRP
jgi:arylsulfatase A-like enzyme